MTAAARGLNDVPKLAGLGALLFQTVLGSKPSLSQALSITLLIAVAMGAGSYIAGLRVTNTLSKKITPMDDREGFAANFATSVLVTAAALSGLPGSTTHVSGGAIMGIAAEARDGRANTRVIKEMLLAWAVTVPGAGALALASLFLTTAVVGTA
jgi:PiT family inorganic phosphate transporter